MAFFGYDEEKWARWKDLTERAMECAREILELCDEWETAMRHGDYARCWDIVHEQERLCELAGKYNAEAKAFVQEEGDDEQGET